MNIPERVTHLVTECRRLTAERDGLRAQLDDVLDELDEAHRALVDVRDRLAEQLGGEVR